MTLNNTYLKGIFIFFMCFVCVVYSAEKSIMVFSFSDADGNSKSIKIDTADASVIVKDSTFVIFAKFSPSSDSGIKLFCADIKERKILKKVIIAPFGFQHRKYHHKVSFEERNGKYYMRQSYSGGRLPENHLLQSGSKLYLLNILGGGFKITEVKDENKK